MSTTTNDRTQELSKVPKVTALPEGCSVAIIDKSGKVLESIEADKFFQAVRDSIQIGGRNLLQGTAPWNPISCEESVTTEEWRGIRDAQVTLTCSKASGYSTARLGFSPEELGEVVLSFEHKGDALVFVQYGWLRKVEEAPAHEYFLISVPASAEWKKYAIHLLMTNHAPAMSSPQIQIRVDAGRSASLRGLKLEKGNIPTDWSPAPEDIIGGGNLLVCRLLQGVIDAVSPQPSQNENFKEINNCLN